jgi:hypothetical protein
MSHLRWFLTESRTAQVVGSLICKLATVAVVVSLALFAAWGSL